jgi:hypothetical protein
MAAERSILAEREGEPGWFSRYRFYSRGRLPRGHETWASSRLSSRRWMSIHLLIEAFWMAPFLAFLVSTGGLAVPVVGWAVVLFMAGMVLSSSLQLRKRAIRELADPPVPAAREVLKQIGEPVPPRGTTNAR